MQRSGALPGSVDAASDRVRLARLALEAALTVPDVFRGNAGSGVRRVTACTSGVLVGVAATAQADGRYSIDLRLVARPVPLRPLADEVRGRVQRAAARVGLDRLLGEVNVEFSDLMTSPLTHSATGHESSTAAAPASEASTSAAARGEAPPLPMPPGVLR